jgi:aminopeptidase N
MRFTALILALLVATPAVAAAPAAPAIPTQLPTGVEPVSYDLVLTPDAAKLTFRGRVAITVQVEKTINRIALNSVDLKLLGASIDGKEAKAIAYPEKQRASFSIGAPLSPGRHVLRIEYTGKINDSPAGLFKVDYDGGRMLATQFEPADARRMLPSFDEPAKKAVFTLSTIVPQDQLAISNMPEESSEPLADGLKRVKFQSTPKMSTYLLFYGLGDMERLSSDVDGTTVSVVIRRGETDKALYALTAAKQLLRYYNDYFGRPYPLPKLDLVAAPGDVAGSMENWGAILFSQTNVIYDPKLSTAGDQQLIYGFVAHEMAHLWSGDLVTMAWWDDLWLNEGFASWMAAKATDKFHPEWRAYLAAIADKDEAMRLDARGSSHAIVQPVATVAQAEQAFDAITYKKGEAVIRMLETYAGADAWRDGVRAYIAEHAYGNATNADLWRAVDKAAGKPVSAVAHDFIEQPGVPLISVAATPAGARLTQGRFGTDAASSKPLTWRTPVALRGLDGLVTEQLISRDEPKTVAGPVVANAGQVGYYRVAYDEASLAPLAAALPRLPSADQYGLLKDSYALGMAGTGPIGAFLRLSAALPADADPVVWRDQARTLAAVDDYYSPGAGRTAYRAWALKVLTPALDRVGFDPKPKEPDNDAVLREDLLLALSRLGDPAVTAEARKRFDASRESLGRLSASERRWVLASVAHTADAKTFQALHDLARAARDPLEKQALYSDLTAVEDPLLAGQVLALAITDEAPSGQAAGLVRRVAAHHPNLAWRFTLANLPAINRVLDTLNRSTFVPRIASASNDPQVADELQAYAAKNIPADTQGEVRVALSKIRTGAEIRAKRLPQIDAWIAGEAKAD